jgi:hypothetical protein
MEFMQSGHDIGHSAPALRLHTLEAPTPLLAFVDLVEQQLVAALEGSRAGLQQRIAMAAALAWLRRPALGGPHSSGLEFDPLAMIHAIVRAHGGLADPHQARLAAAALLAYAATEVTRRPDEGPWSLATGEGQRDCARGLMRMALRLAQGEPSCAELLEAHAEVLAGPQRPTATSHPPALELVCTCAALAVAGPQVDEDSVDRFASAGAATAQIAWWVDELRLLLRPLDRAGFEARRGGPVLALFVAQSSFEQREALVELVDQLPRSSPCVHELLHHSGLVGRCAERIEAARLEVHAQLASVPRPAATDPCALAGLGEWLVSVDALAAQVPRAIAIELAPVPERLVASLGVEPRPSAEQAANEPPSETPPAVETRGLGYGPRTRGRSRRRVQAWASGIAAACEQGLLELCESSPWRRSVRVALAGEGAGAAGLGRGCTDLWAELADELGLEFVEGSLRGAVSYVQGRRLGLIDDLRCERAVQLDPRDAPPIQAALDNLVEHLQAHCSIALDDRIEATRLLARAHAAQWRDARAEVLDPYGWWAAAEALAGEPLAGALVRFCSGQIPSERAAALGRSLGTLAQLGTALASRESGLVRLGPLGVASLVERALTEAQPLLCATTTPFAIRWRGQAWVERLRSPV